jgi:hypothetical protein
MREDSGSKARINHRAIGLAGLAAILCIHLTLATGIGHAADELAEARIELHSGEVLRGNVRLVHPGMYLIQTTDHLYEVGSDEISSVNGQPGPPQLTPESGRLILQSSYNIILPNGDMWNWDKREFTNAGKTVWTHVSWGAKKSELDMFWRMEAYDAYGHRLQHRIEPREKSDLYNVIVDLTIPVMPGEQTTLTCRYFHPGGVKRQGDLFTYTFMGDFPEDRIYYGKVQLPPGAEIERVDPQPIIQCTHEGHLNLAWRRYYPRYESSPLTVVYRLAR